MSKEIVTVVYELLKYFLANKNTSSEQLIANLALSTQETKHGIALLKNNKFVFEYGEGEYYLNPNVIFVVSQMIRAHEEFNRRKAI